MSRWFAMLNALKTSSSSVQNVQIVQNDDKAVSFEHIEQFEQMAEGITEYCTTVFDREAFDERAAIIEANGIPREWAEGYATLCTMPRPTAFTPERWQQLVDDGGYFLDAWGRQAAGLGWRAADVFGANPDAPEQRYDGMGLVPLLCGKAVIAITADTARIESGKKLFVTFYRKTHAENSIVLWEAFKS